MNFEICTDSVEGAIMAEKYGIKRIELCSALSVGGLTPSIGLIQQCVKNSTIEVHVMIRHKEGGCCYSEMDITLMKVDIKKAKKAGAKGAPWDGVRNYQAAKNLKSMKKGDLCFFYHSNIGKEIVGIVEVIKEAYLDKTDKSGRFVAVDVKGIETPSWLLVVPA